MSRGDVLGCVGLCVVSCYYCGRESYIGQKVAPGTSISLDRVLLGRDGRTVSIEIAVGGGEEKSRMEVSAVEWMCEIGG